VRTLALMTLSVLFLLETRASAEEYVSPAYRLETAAHFSCQAKQKQNQAEARRWWKHCASEYEKVTDDGYHHRDLFLSCGNAYLLADELPKAILAYRRGLSLYPVDGDLWENLELARDQVAYPAGGSRERPPGDDWPPFLPRPTPNTVLFSALAAHVLAWVVATAWLMTRQRRVAITAVALFAAALLLGSWWGYLQYRIDEDTRRPLVVVTVNGVPLRRGNGTLFPRHPDLPQVNRGMEARLLSERGGWVQVQFPGGEIGWLPREAVDGSLTLGSPSRGA
jgi:hypothetical protein